MVVCVEYRFSDDSEGVVQDAPLVLLRTRVCERVRACRRAVATGARLFLLAVELWNSLRAEMVVGVEYRFLDYVKSVVDDSLLVQLLLLLLQLLLLLLLQLLLLMHLLICVKLWAD